jgi:hypothetical protein
LIFNGLHASVVTVVNLANVVTSLLPLIDLPARTYGAGQISESAEIVVFFDQSSFKSQFLVKRFGRSESVV